MNRQRLAVATLSLCALGGVLVAIWLSRTHSAGEDQLATLRRRIDALETQLGATQTARRPSSSIESIEAISRSAKSLEQSPTSPDAASLEHVVVPLVEDAATAAARRQYEAGVLEQTLSTEQIDGSTSATFTADLEQALDAEVELAGYQLVDAQCRVTLCRFAVLNRSGDDAESLLGHLGSIPGLGNTEIYWQRHPNADGSSLMTLYAAREGHKLPDYRADAGKGLTK